VQADQYLGSAYADHLVGVNTNVRFLKDFTFDILGEYQGGGMLGNFVGFQNGQRNVWYPCYAAQQAMRAGTADANGITALQRAKCAYTTGPGSGTPQSDYWVQSTNFFKIRSASLSSATLTLAGRNLWKSTNYDGLDPELRDAADAVTSTGTISLARREYYQLPPSKQFLLSARLLF
jgi:hypothetical protein